MKNFLYKLIRFISIPLALIIVVEGSLFFLRKNIFKEEKLEPVFINTGSNYKWISKIDHKNKILLLGSSSVKYGLSCSRLNELSKDSLAFINLSWDARDPVETYFLLKHIDLTNVKSVYMGLDPWIFAKTYYKNRKGYYYLDMDFFSSVQYGHEHDKSIFLKRYKSFYKYFSPSESIQIADNQEIPPDYGSVKLELTPVNFNDPVEEWFQLEKYNWSELQFLYLTKIASFCKNKNIDFYSFIPPKRSDYSETYKLKCGLIHKEFIEKLSKSNFTSPIFGKFDQLDELGDKDLFAEAYHLNAKGQEVYSAIFYKMMHEKTDSFSTDYSWFNKISTAK